MRHRLSTAQLSALECRDWSEEPTLRECWRGAFLEWNADQAEALWSELNEASNAEDAEAERRSGQGLAADVELARYARAAARSLYVLGRRVIRSTA